MTDRQCSLISHSRQLLLIFAMVKASEYLHKIQIIWKKLINRISYRPPKFRAFPVLVFAPQIEHHHRPPLSNLFFRVVSSTAFPIMQMPELVWTNSNEVFFRMVSYPFLPHTLSHRIRVPYYGRLLLLVFISPPARLSYPFSKWCLSFVDLQN